MDAGQVAEFLHEDFVIGDFYGAARIIGTTQVVRFEVVGEGGLRVPDRSDITAGNRLVVEWVRWCVVPDAIALVTVTAPTAKLTAHPVQPLQDIGEPVLGIRHWLAPGPTRA